MGDKLEKAIYGLFDDDYLKEYSNIVETYHNNIAQSERFTPEFKKKAKQTAVKLINELQEDTKEQAMDILEDFEESKEFSLPDRPKPSSRQEELIQATNRNIELQLIRDEMSVSSERELLDMLEGFEDNELLAKDVDSLVRNELKRRDKESYIAEIERRRKPDYSNISQLKSTVSLLTNNGHFSVIEKTDGGINPEYRNIERDLQSGETPTQATTKNDILIKLNKGGEE